MKMVSEAQFMDAFVVLAVSVEPTQDMSDGLTESTQL